MAQSVKLKDGSYIDTEGIYDVTQGKTQKDLNAGKYWAWNMTETKYGNLFNCSSGTAYACQYGKLVVFSIDDMTYKSVSGIQVCKISLTQLGLPKAHSFFSCCLINACALVGEIIADGDSFIIRANGNSTRLWGTVAYFTD